MMTGDEAGSMYRLRRGLGSTAAWTCPGTGCVSGIPRTPLDDFMTLPSHEFLIHDMHDELWKEKLKTI